MIAKELARTLQNTEGFSPKLIRSKDEFIELDERYMRKKNGSRYLCFNPCGWFYTFKSEEHPYIYSPKLPHL